ncbi:adenylyl-sulfate reductase subunit alpha [Candidatus Desulforudis audaxviator]|uniref:Fumarate reductase/succinate dehydrogenase flavoprotein domain protein n=1 Tax=Desulforudis audaxviator (strain MP104C) TaxID=477974 RepID=B1I5T4_DESAP|nr:adenylyl-sulfate reductase subunit alpha [Candidatus Desulforudis audaxviator]ACA60382.1 fumarate reductase/succinate dehydrogenase flavoprotein domain protein [Candidatus Desulforudis audaxviator MP104C]AZK60436.1 Adenylylsulfate reductase alpha-subunit [Candidatus Desulforudis audaxviator]
MAREREYIDADVLIIGGGTAGCLAAWEARQAGGDNLKIVILEKAFIRNSGALSAGMNALNMYVNQGKPEDLVAYIRYDMCGAPVREDILLSVAELVNETVAMMEKEGLPIKKKADGSYLNRGKWNIEINGSLLKPITANMAIKARAKVYNRVYVTDLITVDGQVAGCVGFGVRDGKYYVARGKVVMVCAGGAAGIWRPRGQGDAHHRIWYYPFNTGGSYAMCKRAGAKMVGFDSRFVPVRTKDTYAATGTMSIGMWAPMINAKGEAFMREREEYVKLGGHTAPTPIRVLAYCREMQENRGPCYMDTTRGDPQRVEGLKSQYLDMSPILVLYWGCNDINPGREPVEIDADNPSIVGANAATAGAWTIGTSRMTTVERLFVSGDALGAAPSRFISGSWTCGRLAGRSMVGYIKEKRPELLELDPAVLADLEKKIFAPLERYEKCSFFTSGDPVEGVFPNQMEWRMQHIMEEYCGGRSRWFYVNETNLGIARKLINRMRREQLQYLVAKDLHQLQLAWDVINRLDVCQLVIDHIDYRKETRYPGYVNRTDYPEVDDANFDCFITSVWNAETDELTFDKEPYEQIIPGDRKAQTI